MSKSHQAELGQHLDQLTAPGELYEKLPGGDVRCFACGHRCLVRPGKRGICQVRFNQAGELRVPWGYVAALQADPIEKKPFFHLLSGSEALTFGMLGCDYHCSFCQNWFTSQALRDPAADESLALVRRVSPELLVELAQRSGAAVVASSYNEPLITSEWAVAIFQRAQQAGFKCAYISNGNATPEALHYLRPYICAYKIDLKTMQNAHYRRLGGVLQNVLDSIRLARELGLWVEVVTLIIPGFNDSPAELRAAADFIHSISATIPWHVTAFHPDYKMTDPPPTALATLVRASEIGKAAGLKHIYVGNIPAGMEEYQNTYCPNCNRAVIDRSGFTIHAYRLTAEGCCPYCQASVPGIWTTQPQSVHLSAWGQPRRILL